MKLQNILKNNTQKKELKDLKIFFVGDFKLDTGPGIANKAMKKGMQKINSSFLYSNIDNKVLRVFEMTIKILISDCICFCSPSRGNIVGIKIAKLFKKKTFYLMHGYLTLEKQINNDEGNIVDVKKFEKYMFENTDKTFCVSENFMHYMIKVEPDYAEKFDFNYNGLDLAKINNESRCFNNKKKKNYIVSLGGGRKIKNNLNICKAINKLNIEKGYKLEYIVIGLPYTEKEEMSKYNFVKYYDKLSHEKVLEILSESYLYIQNSEFETFGLAIIEALICKCNLLVSKNIGSVGIIKSMCNDDLIFETNNINEIADKIEKIYYNPNHKRLLEGIDMQLVECEKSANLLLKKIYNLVGKNYEY